MEGEMRRYVVIALCVFILYQDFCTTFAKEAKLKTIAANESKRSYDSKINDTNVVLAYGYRHVDNLNTDSNLLSVGPRKRGIGGIIATFITTGATLASTGISLWTALSGGCNYFPTICTDRNKIQRLEGELKQLSKDYDKAYYDNKWKFLNLREAMINNKYILLYMNDSVREAETIGDIVEVITTTLEVNLKTMAKIYGTNSAGNITDIAGPFEYQFEKIVNTIESMKKFQIIYLVVEKVAEVIVGKLFKYFSNVVKVVDHKKNVNLFNSKTKFSTKIKNYLTTKGKFIGSVVKKVGHDIKHKFKSTIKSGKQWMRAVKSWPKFKAKFKSTFLGPKSTITKIRNFFKHPKTNIKYAIKNYKFSKGQAFSGVMSIALSAVMRYIEAKNWERVRDQLAKTRKVYEDYIIKAQNAMKEVRVETGKLNQYWSKTIDAFKELISYFKDIITEAKKNKVFTDVFGITGTPVDTSHKFFHINLNVVNEKQVKANQYVVMDFFKSNAESLSTLRDKFKIQRVLLTNTKDLVETNKPIISIYNSIKRIYKNYNSEVLVNYSSQFNERDVVCSTAFLIPDRKIYDFYPLGKFRDSKCKITKSVFSKMKRDASKKRVRLHLVNTVKESVQKKKTPSAILDIAKGLYAASDDKTAKAFGLMLKEKDVVCEIASIYPDLQQYMFYDLTPFRKDCSHVSDAKFLRMQDTVKKIRESKDMIEWSMKFCLKLKQCQCPSQLTIVTSLTVQQINALIDGYKQETRKIANCNYVERKKKCSWEC